MPDPDGHEPTSTSVAGGATGHDPAPSIETAPADAPQFHVASTHPERMERSIAVAFLVATAAFAAFGGAYWQNASNFWLGTTLSVGFAGLGVGMVAWGKYLMPQGPFSEARHSLEPTPEEKEAIVSDFASRGKIAVEGRRGLLLKLVGAASAIFGVVAMFPLLRSLGPLPKKLFYTTTWKKGAYLTTAYGNRVHVNDLDKGGVLTVFPHNDVGGAFSQTILVRVDVSTQPIVTKPGRESWGPDGYLAFSKVCTHAGCPVALYQKTSQQLLCPCHQSLFNIGEGRWGYPVFGPAPRPLAQLPLYVDSSGYLRAQKGYDEPVGPGFWERGNS
jgi:ubiquinol-cytochrome c reductase iron-sulfur subunit